MTITSNDSVSRGTELAPQTSQGDDAKRVYHRLSDVRKEQGVSLRSAARQLKLDMATVRYQENPNTNLSIHELMNWQRVLDVPIADLLVEPTNSLSRPIKERANMVRIMKTVQAIAGQAQSVGIKRLTNMLVDQLVEFMPELKEVSAWHSVGQRRSLEEYGRVVDRRMRDDFFIAKRDE
ncbi:MAG: hypothetical protein R3C28_02005 [Pirellulaceae bacterium]